MNLRSIYISSALGLCTFSAFFSYSQNGGTVTGNIESQYQYLLNDSVIQAIQPQQKSLVNTYALVNYSNKGFKAGTRLELYAPRILGYPDRFDGAGVGYRYVGYENEMLSVTVGNFYEQFGTGLIFRAYEDRNLGLDNAMDGLNLRIRPYKGVLIKAIYGKQRFAFEAGRIINSPGIVRGVDGEIFLNEIIPILGEKEVMIKLGGSMVSKFQVANHPEYILPQNVGAYGGRFDVTYKNYYINGEYIIKEADPSWDNNYIFNYGHGLLINAGYSKKGLGILLSAKHIDNMSYRSDREMQVNDGMIGFIPTLTKTHTYNLVAQLYPYVSQPLGEVAYQADVMYKFKPKTLLGGKYGTSVSLNVSTAHGSAHLPTNANPLSRVTYETQLFKSNGKLYWRDINIELKKKLSPKVSLIASYFNLVVNNDVVKVAPTPGIIKAHVGVLEMLFKVNDKHSIRTEIQGLWTENKKDRGHWYTLLVEYTISPDWYISGVFQHNYGNPLSNRRNVYPLLAVGKIWNATRLEARFGRVNAGMFCVGGVCRPVPASSGLTVVFSHSF
jgi:hypothetical protein